MNTAARFGSEPRTSPVAFFLFQLVNSTVFLRPAEIVPELLGLPIYEFLILGCLATSVETIRRECMPKSLYHNPITICVLGIWLACALSHATHGYLSGVIESTSLFFKTALYYLALVATVDTLPRFRWFLLSTVLCATVMVGLCVIDYFGIVDYTFVTHVTDRDGVDETGQVELVWRMRGTGIFQDPNDISLLIMAASVMCFYFMTDKTFSFIGWIWYFPLAVLWTGLFCTRSRGGLMSMGAAFMTYILLRFGRGWTVLAVAVGALALPMVAGRQGEIDLEGGTGQERIQMWAAGLEALKSPDLLFGIGQGFYADLAGLVAHNSYVHSFTELGIFGGTFFFGMFFFGGLALFRITDPEVHCSDSEIHRCAPFVAAMMAGWGVGLFSLSRCYVVPTYMITGMVSAYIALAGPRLQPSQWVVAWNKAHIHRLLVCSVGLLGFLYVFVKVFARFK